MDRPRLALGALIVLTAVVYAPLRTAPFVFEDAHYRGAVPGWQVPGRGLTVATWQITDTPQAGHLLNVGLHLTNTALVAAVGSALVSPLGGVLAAAVFALHPMQTEAVAYLAARGELLVTLGVLLAVLGALRPTWGGLWLLLGGIGLALVSKEIGVVAMPLGLWTLAVFQPGEWRTRLLTTGVGVLGTLLLVVQAERLSAWLAMPATGGGPVVGGLDFVLFQLAAIWRVLLLAVVPVGFSLDPDITGLSAAWPALAVVATGVAGIGLAVTWRRQPVIAWALGWVAIVVAPRLLVPTAEWFHEYYGYPAVVALSILLGWAAAAFITASEAPTRTAWPTVT